MKILHVIERLDDNYGGPAKSVPILCNALNSLGSENIIASVNSGASVNEAVVKYNLDWRKFEPSGVDGFYFSTAFYREIEDLIKDADVVHFHSIWTFPTYVAWRVLRKLRKPYIVSPRSNLYAASLAKSYYKKRLFRALFVDNLLLDAAAVVASNEQERIEASLLGKLSLEVIPNAIDSREFDDCGSVSDARETFSLPVDGKLLSYISRIHPRKGFHLLVDAWLKIREDFDCSLVVAGPIDDADYFREQLRKVEAVNASSDFYYLGMLTGQDRIKAFKAGDLLVLPSLFENFGMCLAESMLAGVPVVTTRDTPWHSLNEIDAGWCIDREHLEATMRMALSADLRTKGQLARQFVLEKYSEGSIANDFMSLYKKLIME